MVTAGGNAQCHHPLSHGQLPFLARLAPQGITGIRLQYDPAPVSKITAFFIGDQVSIIELTFSWFNYCHRGVYVRLFSQPSLLLFSIISRMRSRHEYPVSQRKSALVNRVPAEFFFLLQSTHNFICKMRLLGTRTIKFSNS